MRMVSVLYEWYQNVLYALLGKDYSIRVFQWLVVNVCMNIAYIIPIMLASCLMTSVTHYAQNYDGLIYN